jgi:cytochrome c peroxidase
MRGVRSAWMVAGLAAALVAACAAGPLLARGDAPTTQAGGAGAQAVRGDGRVATAQVARTQPAGDSDEHATLVAAAAAERRRVRPVLSDAEYAAQAAELRKAYAAPPGQWPAMDVDAGVHAPELGLLPEPPFPKDNPYSKPKALLGKMLFFDPRLSGSGQFACASCHDPDLAWADGRTVGFGHDREALPRNVPSLVGAAYQSHLFWDGRASSLEQQARMPIVASNEMHGDSEKIVATLGAQADYRAAFKDAFGDEAVTMQRVGQAIATFERVIPVGRSPFDRFLKGKTEALSDAALRGLHLFRTDAKCMNCHSGPNFSDDGFHDLGLSYYGRALQDLGRYEQTKQAADVGAFRTPSLRDVGRTAPYMHVGLFTLDGVLELYNAGMPTLRRTAAQANDPLFPTKDKRLHALHLNAHDLGDLKEFLEALDEPLLRVKPPVLPGMRGAGTQPVGP